MKTAFYPSPVARASRSVLTVLLVLAVLMAALPRPAQAAVQADSCGRTHVVQEGETTGQIAHRYGLKWSEIARANDLKRPYELEAGQRLCIPVDEDDEDTATSMTFSLTVAGGRAYVTINKLTGRTVFLVKARSAEVGVGGWKKLGSLRAGKNEKVTVVYSLPASLRDSLYINVCLKNTTTDALICRSALNVR